MSRSTVVLFSITGIIVVSVTISFVAFNTASPTTNNLSSATNTQLPATNTQPAPSSTPTPAPKGCTVTNLSGGYVSGVSSIPNSGGGHPNVDVIINNVIYTLPSLIDIGTRTLLVEFSCSNGFDQPILPLTINNAGGASAELGSNGKYSFTIDQKVLSDYASSGQVLKVDAPNANGIVENIISFAVRLNPTPSPAPIVPSNTPRPQVLSTSTPQVSLTESYNPAGCSWYEGLARFIHLINGKPAALKSDAPNFKYGGRDFDVLDERVFGDGSFWAKPIAAKLSDMQDVLVTLGICARPTPQPGKPGGDGGGGSGTVGTGTGTTPIDDGPGGGGAGGCTIGAICP